MSAPDPMPCDDPPCIAPLACQFAGSCRHRRMDSARSYDEALRACREQGRIPKSWREEKKP
jgi:hypothetical protein